MTHVRASFLRADQRAIVDDHGKRRVNFLCHRKSKIIAAACDQGNFYSTFGGFCDGGAIGFGDLPAAVQQGTVDIKGDEAHRHIAIISWFCVFSVGLQAALT